MRHILSWKDITVQQFLDIDKLGSDKSLNEIEKSERAVCILYDLTEKQVGDLPMPEFNRLCKEIGFIIKMSEIPGKAVNYIKVGKKKYRIIYDPSKLKHRQYVELMHFGDKPVENMHLIMASVVQRVNWLGVAIKNKAEDHEAVASDMLQAPVISVYHSCVFFCKLYVSLIANMKDYLVNQLMISGASRTKAESLLTTSIKIMDGFTPQSNYQISTAGT